MYTLIIIICFNNDNGLVKVCYPYRRCHQVKYTAAMSERSLKTFLKIDSRQRSLVSSLYFHSLYRFAKEFVRNDQDFLRFFFCEKRKQKTNKKTQKSNNRNILISLVPCKLLQDTIVMYFHNPLQAIRKLPCKSVSIHKFEHNAVCRQLKV